MTGPPQTYTRSEIESYIDEVYAQQNEIDNELLEFIQKTVGSDTATYDGIVNIVVRYHAMMANMIKRIDSNQHVTDMIIAQCNKEYEQRGYAELAQAEAEQLLKDERKDREDTEGMLRIALEEMRKRDQRIRKFLMDGISPRLHEELEKLGFEDFIKKAINDYLL